MKKALSLVLALGMAVSTMSAPALAEEGGEFNIRACIASERRPSTPTWRIRWMPLCTPCTCLRD